jgi:hypothetical protein
MPCRARKEVVVNIRLKKLLSVVVVAMLTGATLYGLTELAVSGYYYPDPPEADYPPPRDALEARQQDIAYFRHYLDLDRSYTGQTRAAAEEVLAAMAPGLAGMTDAEFELGIARAVALADNGHSNIWLGRFSRTHGRLPIRLYWFADGVHVVRARSDQADLLGAELLAIGDTPLAEAARRLRAYVGGTWESLRAYRGPVLLELTAAHHAAGLSDSEQVSTLTFMLPDGSLLERKLEAEQLAEDAPLYWGSSYLYESVPESEQEPWYSLASRVESLPLYLREPARQFRLAELPGNGLYLQYRANVGDGIGDFDTQVRERAREMRPDYLVIDQRFNGGGDYTKTAGLMMDLPELVANEGPLYVITGPATFSAGINSVAFVKSTGGDRVIILGERVGDRERIYGETNEFELPNSRLGMTFNTGLHDVENGCPPFPECYFRNYFYDVAVGKLDPNVPIETGFGDYMAGVDPVLDFVLARYQRRAETGAL